MTYTSNAPCCIALQPRNEMQLRCFLFAQVVGRAPEAACVSAPRASARGSTAPPCGGHRRRDGQREKHADPPVHPGGGAGKTGGENKAV